MTPKIHDHHPKKILLCHVDAAAYFSQFNTKCLKKLKKNKYKSERDPQPKGERETRLKRKRERAKKMKSKQR